MQHRPITPSCARILHRFSAGVHRLRDPALAPQHLVVALLAEQSLGARCLSDLGITATDILSPDQPQPPELNSESADIPDLPESLQNSAPDFNKEPLSCGWCETILDRASVIARRQYDADEVSSEHLLQAMLEIDGPVKKLLADLGVDPATVQSQLDGQAGVACCSEALAVDFELQVDAALTSVPPETPTTADPRSSGLPAEPALPRVRALVDANLNRAREGLRVLEDFARFVCREPSATSALKQLRHTLVACERALRQEIGDLMNHRNTTADVGTEITTAEESCRQSLGDVVVANARRVQEALRSLEEFGKLLSPQFAEQIKQLRYTSYDLEQRLTAAAARSVPQCGRSRNERRARLATAQLYVLITEANCRLPWQEVVARSLAGGADVLQLREKSLSQDEIVRRGKWISAACKAHDALFILNDRCELAGVANADGGHIGQSDASVAAARRDLGDSLLLGLSTHNRSQLELACSQDVDYLGVGPVFSSHTKSFAQFPGMQFVATAAECVDLPWFAIGGLNPANVEPLRQAGARRIAVSNAVIASAEPEQAARQLRLALRSTTETEPLTFRMDQG